MGLANKAIVEVETSSGSKYHRSMIIKLAIGNMKENIINEYQVYKQLARSGVTRGIVGAHDLFHDIETGAMLMLKDDAGISLTDRYKQEDVKANGDGEPALVTEKERSELVGILWGIHRASIIHRDLTPENITINEDGELFIIDFDCAEHRMYISGAMFEEDQEALQESLEVEQEDEPTSFF